MTIKSLITIICMTVYYDMNDRKLRAQQLIVTHLSTPQNEKQNMWALLSAHPGAISVGQKPFSYWKHLLNMHRRTQPRETCDADVQRFCYRGPRNSCTQPELWDLGRPLWRDGCVGQSLTEEYERVFFLHMRKSQRC